MDYILILKSVSEHNNVTFFSQPSWNYNQKILEIHQEVEKLKERMKLPKILLDTS